MTDQPQEHESEQTEQPVPIEPVAEPPAEELPKPSKDARTMAMRVHLLSIFTWVVGPLVIYLVKKNKDRFIAFHALQAFYWELAVMVCVVVASGIIFLIYGRGGGAVMGVASGVIGLIDMVFNIILFIKAGNGEWAEYPLVGAWAKK